MEPIKSQKEADQVFKFLVKQTVNTLGISIVQAEKRVRALLDSGIIERGNPDNIHTQMQIDEFLNKPI